MAHALRVQVWRVWRPDVHGVRILVLDGQDRVLLVRHSYGSDKWTPPGGGMRRSEDPLLAGARELREETGCRLIEPRVLQISDENLHGSSNAVRIVVGRTGDEPRADGREIIEVRFFALDALPAHMPAGLARRVQAWAAQIT
ncbi:NUDIX domain-containing protein [Novosphingobium barchaimii]|uniref:NUDIX domain-containing protein n=1 Tax=Novosphingobium barchaimii TaxID=1420591 RepID=UPI000A58F835|nr:NUDIX domain-containing protein [Novosphingobium barchaimii]